MGIFVKHYCFMKILTDSPLLVPPGGPSFDFGGLGVDWKLDGAESTGRFSIVHHPMAPRALAAPLHRHSREDEFSFVLKGRLGVLSDGEVVEAGPGTWVRKPRGVWHTFWNASDEPTEIIEVISPAGFEDFFREVAQVRGDPAGIAAVSERYGLEMDFASVPGLCERFGLTFPQF